MSTAASSTAVPLRPIGEDNASALPADPPPSDGRRGATHCRSNSDKSIMSIPPAAPTAPKPVVAAGKPMTASEILAAKKAGVAAAGSVESASTPMKSSAVLGGELHLYGHMCDGLEGMPGGPPGSCPHVVNFSASVAIKSLACGNRHALVLSDTGQVWTMGEGVEGQLGLNSKRNEEQPRVVSISKGRKQIYMRSVAAGKDHSVAVSSSGDMYVWGRNDLGQLGQGDQGVPKMVPTIVPTLSDTNGRLKCISASCGESFTAVVICGNQSSESELAKSPTSEMDEDERARTTGDVWAWGSNDSHQFGVIEKLTKNPEKEPSGKNDEDGGGDDDDENEGVALIPVPVTLPSLTDGSRPSVREISCGEEHMLVLLFGNAGLLQFSDDIESRGPILAGEGVVSIATGRMFSMALTKDGRVFTWAVSVDGAKKGQLGRRTKAIKKCPESVLADVGPEWAAADVEGDCSTPGLISNMKEHRVCRISAGYAHMALLTTKGRLFTCGENDKGQLGYIPPGGANYSLVPRNVPSSTTNRPYVSVVCGGQFTLAAVLLVANKRSSAANVMTDAEELVLTRQALSETQTIVDETKKKLTEAEAREERLKGHLGQYERYSQALRQEVASAGCLCFKKPSKLPKPLLK